MSQFFKEVNKTPHSKKTLNHTPKPYWAEELSDLWKMDHTVEKEFVKMRKDDSRYTQVLANFKYRHRIFDRTLRKEKRVFHRREVYDLDKSNTNNPTEFWRTIEDLGPKKVKEILMEVILENGDVSDAFDDILHKWRDDFQQLFTPSDNRTDAQKTFWEEIRLGNRSAESSWNEANVNALLNVHITKMKLPRFYTIASVEKHQA